MTNEIDDKREEFVTRLQGLCDEYMEFRRKENKMRVTEAIADIISGSTHVALCCFAHCKIPLEEVQRTLNEGAEKFYNDLREMKESN